MDINQHQKERLQDLVNRQSDKIEKIEQITDSVFAVQYFDGITMFLNISKLGKVKSHSYDMIYHKEYKPVIK